MINVALPKGRLGEKAYSLFCAAGYGSSELGDIGRRLSFCDEKSGVNYFWVKPSDVAVYVERGAADAGVAGKDVLDEDRADVYELIDLGIGKCKMFVAARKDFAQCGAVLRIDRTADNGHKAQRLGGACACIGAVRRYIRYRRNGRNAKSQRLARDDRSVRNKRAVRCQ